VLKQMARFLTFIMFLCLYSNKASAEDFHFIDMTGIYGTRDSVGLESTFLWLPNARDPPQVGLGLTIGGTSFERYYYEYEALLGFMAAHSYVAVGGIFTASYGQYREPGQKSGSQRTLSFTPAFIIPLPTIYVRYKDYENRLPTKEYGLMVKFPILTGIIDKKIDRARSKRYDKQSAELKQRLRKLAKEKSKIYSDEYRVIGVGDAEPLYGLYYTGKDVLVKANNKIKVLKMHSGKPFFSAGIDDDPEFVGGINGSGLFIFYPSQIARFLDKEFADNSNRYLCAVELTQKTRPKCASRILSISSKNSKQVFIGTVAGNQLKAVNSFEDEPEIELLTFDETLTKRRQNTFTIPHKSKDCDFRHEVVRGIDQALIVRTSVYEGKAKCSRQEIVTLIDKRDSLLWSTPLDPGVYDMKVDEFGQIYFNQGEVKLSKDGKLDHEHSKKYKELQKTNLRDSVNPYTDFSPKVGKSSDGRLLAPINMIVNLIEARGYKQIEELPDDMKAEFEKGSFVSSVGVALESAISGSIFGPNDHVLIVGRFVLEKDGEIFMSFVDLGPL
jgi:hypothetical protein